MIIDKAVKTKELSLFNIVNRPEIKVKQAINGSFLDRLDKSNDDELINMQISKVKKELKKWQSDISLTELANLYILKGKHDRAIKHYEEAINRNPDNLSVYDNLINLYIYVQHIDKANNLFKNLIEKSQRQIQVVHRYILFYLFFYADNTETIGLCLKLVDELIERDPMNAEVVNTKGFIFLNFQNNINDAEIQFMRALEINPSYLNAMNNLAVCYMNTNKPSDAKELLLKVLNIDRYYLGAYENLTTLSLKSNSFDVALQYLKDALELGLKLPRVWDHKIGWLLIAIKQFDEAEAWYLEKIAAEPENFFLYNNLGVIYHNKNELNNAIELFKMAAKGFVNNFVNDQSILPFKNLIEIGYNKDRPELMEWVKTHLDKFKKTNKIPIAVIALQGEIYSNMRKYELAEERFLLVIEEQPLNDTALIGLSFIYSVIHNDYNATIELLEGKVSDTTSYLITNNLLHAYIKVEDFHKANLLLERFSKLKEPLYYMNKALYLLKKDNDLKKASNLYKKAKKIIHPYLKDSLERTWNMEMAYYYYKKGDIKKAKSFLSKVNLEDERLLLEIRSLSESINLD